VISVSSMNVFVGTIIKEKPASLFSSIGHLGYRSRLLSHSRARRTCWANCRIGRTYRVRA
jgi:hypothetical protein